MNIKNSQDTKNVFTFLVYKATSADESNYCGIKCSASVTECKETLISGCYFRFEFNNN